MTRDYFESKTIESANLDAKYMVSHGYKNVKIRRFRGKYRVYGDQPQRLGVNAFGVRL